MNIDRPLYASTVVEGLVLLNSGWIILQPRSNPLGALLSPFAASKGRAAVLKGKTQLVCPKAS